MFLCVESADAAARDTARRETQRADARDMTEGEESGRERRQAKGETVRVGGQKAAS